jgi:hypothetical protein
MQITGNTCRLLIAACFLIWAGHAQADLVTNGSFENTGSTFVGDVNKTDVLASGSSAIPGWTTTNGVPLAWIENGNPWNIPASDGSFFLDLTSYADFGTYGGVTQTLATTAGTNYVVTFDLGYGGNSAGFSGPVSVTATAGGSSGIFTSPSGDPNPALWSTETLGFMATSSTTQLTITGLSTAGGFYIGLDNVHAEAATVGAVPEPRTIYLLGSVLVGLVIRRQRFPRPSGTPR